MATIQVTLTEEEVRAAVMAWAVTRVLNEGHAVACKFIATKAEVYSVTRIEGARVTVETERSAAIAPSSIASFPTPHPDFSPDQGG
jgi:hypothetical protein